MKFLFNLNRFSDIGLLFPRFAIGIIFIQHGLMKWGLWSMQPSEQLPASMLMILRILSIAEPLGGAALILGLLTPYAAIGMGLVMAGVINMKVNMMKVAFIGQNTTGWEFDFLILFSVIGLILAGPGRFSLDRRLFKTGPATS